MCRLKLLFLFLLCSITVAQSLDEQDNLLGFKTHYNIVAKNRVIPSGQVVSLVTDVWRNMVAAPSYAGSTIPPSLFLLDAPVINAFATAGGRLYVYRGLVEAVNGNQGVIAFVIGHEMAHNRLQHGVRRYLRAVNADYTIRQAYRQGNWAGLAAQVAWKIAEAKAERDEEHEADRAGLLLAAEAGYHPDFAVAAARELRMTTGESSKFAAFFQGHPRWTTREQRAEGMRDRAVAVFKSRWPDVASSPGGEPPTMVVVEDFKLAKDQKGIYHVSFTSDVRSVKSEPVEITAFIVREKPTEAVILGQKSFLSSDAQPWSLEIGKKPKDKSGKRFLKIVAVSNGKALFDSEPKKID